MIKIIKLIIRVLFYFFPKNRNKIVFKSYPDRSGNAMALYEYIQSNHKEYELFWLVNNIVEHDDIKFFSLKGLYTYISSKYIVTTHNDLISISPKNQKYISLWHGMTLKKIGYMNEEYKWMESYDGARISTSEITRALIAASFNEPANHVHITGQPICDYLFRPYDLNGFNLPKDVNKIITYMPTFREELNSSKVEGNKVSVDNIFRLDGYLHDDFLEYIKEKKIFIFIKLHPAEQFLIQDIKTNEYIRFLNDDKINIYKVLAFSDMLITDYSSVYIDYLILNRPVGFVVPDLDKYAKGRNGFSLEPYDYWAVGEKITTIKQFYEFFDGVCTSSDLYKKERKDIVKVLHKFVDDKSSERVFERLIKNV